MSLTITSPSFDRIYTMYAWRDNNIRLVLTQGEGLATTDGTVAHVKAPKFQLRDDRGVIDLTSCEVSLALTRPDGSEDLLACSSASGEAAQGIISCPITASATAIAGQATGEIRVLSTDNNSSVGVIKFFGVHFQIYNGVSDAAAAQSTQFSALIAALQEVSVVTPEPGSENVYNVRLDTELAHNGTNPVASGVIFDKTIKYKEIQSSEVDTSTRSDYIYRGIDEDGYYFLMLCARNPNGTRKTQYKLYTTSPTSDNRGKITFRTYNSSTSRWSEWEPIGTLANIANNAITSPKIVDGAITENKIADGAVTEDKLANGSVTIEKLSFDISEVADEITQQMVEEAVADGIIKNFDSITPDKEYNAHSSRVEAYMTLTPKQPNESGTYIALDLNERSEIPNSTSVTIPTGGSKIIICDTVTLNKWSDSVTGSSYNIKNLIPERLYTYLVTNSDGEILVSGGCMAHNQVRFIDAGSMTPYLLPRVAPEQDNTTTRQYFNIRDLGGWDCDGGKLKYGMIYRGCELSGIYKAGSTTYGFQPEEYQKSLFRDFLGIRDEIDLRQGSNDLYTNTETTGDDTYYDTVDDINESAIGACVGYERFSVREYGKNGSSYNLLAEYALPLKRIARDLADGKPVYIHCSAGADRTGTLCMLVEAICGVSRADLDRDYELTSFSKQFYDSLNNIRTRNGYRGSAQPHLWDSLIVYIENNFGNSNDSFRDKVIDFAIKSGVTIEEINTIRGGLIDGIVDNIKHPYIKATISKTLSHAVVDNDVEKVEKYQPFKARVLPNDGYILTSVSVTMGGTDITSTAYNAERILIPKVTGDITITASATDVVIPDVSGKADKATTLAGYGITDGQTKIDSTHKLSSDLVDDTNKSNKFVTSSEKTAWGNKYDKPSGGIPKTDFSSAVQTSLGKADSALQTPSGGTVGQVLTKTASAAEWKDIPNEYEFVNEIPQNANHSQKYVLPDGYIYEWQEGSASVPSDYNTKIINKRPSTNANYQTALNNQAGTLCSDLIPVDTTWGYSSSTSGNAHYADITISGISKLIPAYNNNAIIIYYYRRDNGNAMGAALAKDLATLNQPAAGSDISLPVTFSLIDQNIYFSGMDASNPAASIGYVRVMIGISSTNITEDDVANVKINVPFYDIPSTPGGWVNTGVKHPFYLKDSIFDVNTNQVLYAVGDSITYGYGVGGNNYSWVKHVIDHNGYAAYGTNGSKNLGENNLGFCTNSTSSFGNHSIQDVVDGTSFAGADIVTVALGINDWKNASATLANFWSGMQYCFNKIRTDNPYCKIYYILPFNVSFAGSYSTFYGLGFKGDSDTTKCYAYKLQEFINLIKAKFEEAAFKAYRVELIDMTECAAINRQNITTALIDDRSSGGSDYGLHPTAATHAVLGKEIARIIAESHIVNATP